MTETPVPAIVLLGGPNGAGKSTVAPLILQDELMVTEFVNADLIAAGISAFAPQEAAILAGRILLSRAKQLAAKRESFALESTLASRSLAPWIKSLVATGYSFHLVFLWLPSADVAVARVAGRVRSGGHNVPEETIRRRYEAGLQNLFLLYLPLAAGWRVLDNSGMKVKMLASGRGEQLEACSDPALWSALKERYGR